MISSFLFLFQREKKRKEAKEKEKRNGKQKFRFAFLCGYNSKLYVIASRSMGRTFVFAEGKDTLKGVAGRGSKIK